MDDLPRVDDLDVPAEDSAEVKGGLLLPAVQKIREAAARTKGGTQIQDPSSNGDWIADTERS